MPNENLNVGDPGHLAESILVAALLNHVVYAAEYGVTADGVTDDRAALQAAIDAANGKRLILPPGDIVLATPVILTARERSGNGRCKVASIEGQGINTTTLLPTTTAIEVDVEDGNVARLTLCDFRVSGGSKAVHIYGGFTLEHTGVLHNCNFERLYFSNQSNVGLHTECEFIRNVCQQVNVQGTWNGSAGVSPNYGVWMAGSMAKFKNVFRDCNFSNTLLAGFYADSSTGSATAELTFENVAFESNWRHALRLNRARNVALRSGYFENNNRDAGGYADVHVEPIGADFPVFFLTFDQCGGSYDLGVQQPQIFLYAGSGDLENVLVNMCSVGGYEIHTNGATAQVEVIGKTGSVIRSIPEVVVT